MDEGRDDQAGAHPQRGQNLVEGREHGRLRLPRLHVGTEVRPQGRTEVPGRGSFQEKRAAHQGQDRRSSEAGRKGIVAESARQTEPQTCGLVGLFQLRNPRSCLPGRRSLCHRARSPLPRQTAQGARTRDTPVFLERNPWKIWGGPTPPNSRNRRRGSTVKSVGKPDAGNPHKRLPRVRYRFSIEKKLMNVVPAEYIAAFPKKTNRQFLEC